MYILNERYAEVRYEDLVLEDTSHSYRSRKPESERQLVCMHDQQGVHCRRRGQPINKKDTKDALYTHPVVLI